MKLKTIYFDKSFIKDVFHKSLPLIIGTIFMGLITLLDNFMIGLFQPNGASELAAASLASKYIKIVNIFINASIAMFSFLIFQYKGANNNEGIRAIMKSMVVIVLLIDAVGILIAYLAADPIMHLFQGNNYSNNSTAHGLAQDYMKVLIFTTIPSSLIIVFLVGMNAYGIQKIMITTVIVSLGINALLNYVFYKVAGLGIEGIAYSTLVANVVVLFIIFWWIIKNDLAKVLLFNPFMLWKIKLNYYKNGSKKISMALQSILWSSISLGVLIIYSNWYGDIANVRLAIVAPVVSIFYTALDGISSTKGYFVGIKVGQGDKPGALISDKRINMYTFIIASIEGLTLIALAFVIPLAWTTVPDSVHFDVSLMLIAVGATYPIAAISKTLLGSFKIAGMGKTIILSNGLFSLCFEFAVPLILFLLSKYTNTIDLDFWEVYLIARLIKLLKLPPTVYYWRQKKWLEKVV